MLVLALHVVFLCAVMLDTSLQFSRQLKGLTLQCALVYILGRIRRNSGQQLKLF